MFFSTSSLVQDEALHDVRRPSADTSMNTHPARRAVRGKRCPGEENGGEKKGVVKERCTSEAGCVRWVKADDHGGDQAGDRCDAEW